RRRPFRDFERLDRRQMRADPHDDADRGDRAPQAEHHAPIDQAQQPEAAPGRPSPARAPACARLSLDRGFGLVLIVGFDDLAFEGLLLRPVFFGWRDPVLQRQAQFGQRCAKAEYRLLASAAIFLSPRPPRTPTSCCCGHGNGAGLKPSYNIGLSVALRYFKETLI